MSAQGRRLARGPVLAGWFLELEEMLERRKAANARRRASNRHRGLYSPVYSDRR